MPRRPRMVLLTATLTPAAAMTQLAARDVGQRRRDYERVLRHVLPIAARCGADVVLAENSGSDLDSLRAIAAEFPSPSRVEILGVRGNEHPEWGRGYAEAELVTNAIAESELIRTAQPDTLIWKITGRYRVVNLEPLLQRTPEKAELVINMRRYPDAWADLHVTGFTRAGWSLLWDAREVLLERPDRNSAELGVYQLVDRYLREGRNIAPRLPVEPRLDGTRGVDNRPYDSPRQRAKYVARVIGRRVAPALWI